MKKSIENHEDEPFAGCENPDVPMAHWLLKHMPERPRNVLDVGCGTGLHTKYLNEIGINCVGITINKDEIAQRKHEAVTYGDMTDIPYVDGTFDCVFCLGSLEHTFNPFAALREFNRVLVTGGHLFFDMPNIYNMEIMDPGYWYHKSVLFPIQCRDLLMKSQFDIVHAEYEEKINGVFVTASTQGYYLARKNGNPMRWGS